ncbi:MAG: cytochrome c [Caulobacteraceae bacterium]
MMRHTNLRAFAAAVLLTAGAVSTAWGQEPRGDSPGGGGTKAPVPVTGEQVYRQVCQACHMADGRGGSGAAAIPALAGNPRLGVAAYPITIVLKGKGAMPWLGDILSPAQIANVVGYVRTHFGNAYPEPVTEAEVSRLAAAIASASPGTKPAPGR